MASLDLMQQLRPLDMSSPGFHDQLSNILYGEEYKRRVGDLQGDDLVSLVDYLDKARYRLAFPCLCLDHHRLSMLSTLPALLSGNVYANSEAYVAPRLYYRPPTSSRPQSSTSIASLSPQEARGTSSKGPSTDQRFASNVLGYTPGTALVKPQKCTIDAITPPCTVADESHRPFTRRL